MTHPKTWYEYHAAKFEADTAHLTNEEVGAYQRLLNFHFMHGSIPAEPERLRRILRESNKKTLDLMAVLEPYFSLENGRYFQKRMVETIAKATDISEKRREAGRKGGEANAKAIAEAKGQAIVKTVTDTVTKELKNNLSAEPTCPHEKIIDLYHEVLPELPAIKKALWPGSKDAQNLLARWKQHEAHRDLDWWRGFFEAVRRNPHWMGENDRGWKANLRWLVNRANFTKVVERWSNE